MKNAWKKTSWAGIDCPKCKAPAGSRCIFPLVGMRQLYKKKLAVAHKERLDAAPVKIKQKLSNESYTICGLGSSACKRKSHSMCTGYVFMNHGLEKPKCGCRCHVSAYPIKVLDKSTSPVV